jgi:hypothetical protein
MDRLIRADDTAVYGDKVMPAAPGGARPKQQACSGR